MNLELLDYVAEDGRAYRGFIAKPDRAGRLPAMLIAHEAPGLLEHSKRVALKLADIGYVAFALDYLGNGRVLTTMPEVAEHVAQWVAEPTALRLACHAAHEVLRERDDVDPRRIAGFGYCFGGQALVEYARTGADLVAVVGFHPGMSVNRPEESVKIRARLLMLVGTADPITPAAHRAAFEDEMDRAGVSWRMVLYGGAPHSFTNADADAAAVLGVAYEPVADTDSWNTALRFLEECGMGPRVRTD